MNFGSVAFNYLHYKIILDLYLCIIIMLFFYYLKRCKILSFSKNGTKLTSILEKHCSEMLVVLSRAVNAVDYVFQTGLKAMAPNSHIRCIERQTLPTDHSNRLCTRCRRVITTCHRSLAASVSLCHNYER